MSKYLYYYLYQITNLLNGKIYIGIHRTNDLSDGYMGSGSLLLRSQLKYGINNFKKEILEFFKDEQSLFQREIEYVNEEFILREDTYNLTLGGNGTFTKEASSKGGKIGGKINGPKNAKKCKDLEKGIFSEDQKKYLVSEENLNLLLKMNRNAWSPEAIRKRKETFRMNKHQQGERNSRFGTMWITNGEISKVIKLNDEIPLGWRKGRIQKKK